MARRGRLAVIGVVAAALMGFAAVGCDDGSDGTLVIVNGGGGTAPTNSNSNTPPPSGFTVVDTDPGGGLILESSDGTARRISGQFHEDVLMAAQYDWYLDAPMFMGKDDASVTPVLTIEAGTTIYGRGGTPPSMLVIRRGATIQAVGTAAAPIVFTSAQPAGARAPGDWGGLIINGRATVNEPNPLGEGASGPYGGTNDDDDSGTLRYVRVEFAGHIFTSTDELNGLALQGVGRGTEIDFIQLHRASDDGIELFGGTVDVKHVLATGGNDDFLDWTFGWRGRAQFVVLQQWDGGADNGIEADNNGTDNSRLPRSHPVISNMTIIGAPTAGQTSNMALLLRQGTAANIVNSVFVDMNTAGLDIDQSSTFNVAFTDATYTALTGDLTVSNSWFFANALDFRDDGADPTTDSNFNALQADPNTTGADPQLEDVTSPSAPDYRPRAGSPLLVGPWVAPDPGPNGPSVAGFFTTVTYLGAMDRTDWTAGWTTHAAN